MDPCVLIARAVAAKGRPAHAFDPSRHDRRIVKGASFEHVLLDSERASVRLDLVEGSLTAGPVLLRFDIASDERLAHQLDAISSLWQPRPALRQEQMARRLLGLQAHDLRGAGASLRETARLVLGPGDWPGTGDHRKSLVRRMIAAGARMIADGPGAVLNARR